MYTIKEVFSDSISELDIFQIVQFCDENGDSSNYLYQHHNLDQPKNNWYDVMFKEKRFSKVQGGLCLLYFNDDLVGISGYNQTEFSSDIWISGARTLIHKEHRNNVLISSYIVPYQIKAILKRNGKCVLWLFDAHNTKTIFKIVKKGKLNVLLQNKLDFFKETAYTDLKMLEYPIIINNTLQNVIYQYLDPEYTFDWNSLECTM